MERRAQLSVELAAPAEVVAATVSDLAQLEQLHPLLRSIRLEREVDGVRTWRCEDRIFGFTLIYFAEQRLEPGGLRWQSVVRQRGLTLTNLSSVTPIERGSRLDEHLTFVGPAVQVLFASSVGVRAHQQLFAAIARRFAS